MRAGASPSGGATGSSVASPTDTGSLAAAQRPRIQDARLVAPALVAWATAFVAVLGASWWAVAAAWAVVGALLLAMGAARRSGSSRAAMTSVLAVTLLAASAGALVVTSTVVREGLRHPSDLEDAVTRHRHVELLVTASAAASPDSRYVAARAGDAPVIVFAPFERRVDPGSQLLVSGTVQSADPGDDVSYLVFSDEAPAERAPPPWWMSWSAGMRESFAAASARLPGDGGMLLPGLAIGDDSGVPDDLDAAMTASSLSHLTAVSGANCAVIVALALGAARALGLGRRTRVVLALGLLGGFVVLVTPQASVVRAAVMAGILLLGGVGGRSGRGLPVLCLAVVVLLALDPWLARDYGFALSVLATGALIALAPPLGVALARVLPLSLARLLAIPLAAQLVCQPVLVLLQPRIPVYGVLANVLAEPAAPVATVVGLAACAVGAVAPGAAVPLAAIAWVPAAWIGAVARFASSMPASAIPWAEGVPGLVLLALLTVGGLVAVLAPVRRSGPRGIRMLRPLAALVTAALVVALGTATVTTRIASQLARPAAWEFAACDVGQGDAFLIRSGSSVALVDTGPDPAPLTACLDDLGIGRIDLLILTHYDADHVGGVDAVIGRVTTALVGPTDASDQVALQQRLAQGGADVRAGERGTTGRLGDLDWRLLWPELPLHGVDPGNQASLTLLVTCPGASGAASDSGAGSGSGVDSHPSGGGASTGCLSGLFLGDLGAEGQSALLEQGPLPHVDIVKVAHHGSADQDAETYQDAAASVGLIGVGIDNDYGHPTQKLLDMLAAAGTTAERTDLDGMVLVGAGPTPGAVSVWSEKHVVGPG